MQSTVLKSMHLEVQQLPPIRHDRNQPKNSIQLPSIYKHTNHSKGSTSNGTENLCKDIWNDEFEIKVSAYLGFQISVMVFDWQMNRIWKLSWKQIQK